MTSGEMTSARKISAVKIYGSFVLKPSQTVRVSTITWYRFYANDLISSFGSLVISVMAIMRFFLSYYNTYQQDRAMLASLYGESRSTERTSSSHDVKFGLAYAVEAF